MDDKEIMGKLEKYKLTSFQKRVLLATYSIKKGKTMTYKQIAAIAGNKNAYRAVGTIMRNNPLAPTIPCHRVVKSDGTLGNYSGNGGRAGKRAMLVAEGAIK